MLKLKTKYALPDSYGDMMIVTQYARPNRKQSQLRKWIKAI